MSPLGIHQLFFLQESSCEGPEMMMLRATAPALIVSLKLIQVISYL